MSSFCPHRAWVTAFAVLAAWSGLSYEIVCRAVEPSAAEMDQASQWISARFAANSVMRLPYSFRYAGRSSSELIGSWRVEERVKELDPRRTQRILTRTDPRTGLEVRLQITRYRDYPAVEWVLYFKNTGSADTPILDQVHAVDTPIDIPVGGDKWGLALSVGAYKTRRKV